MFYIKDEIVSTNTKFKENQEQIKIINFLDEFLSKLFKIKWLLLCLKRHHYLRYLLFKILNVKGLYLYGPVGTGKTTLVLAANKVLNKNLGESTSQLIHFHKWLLQINKLHKQFINKDKNVIVNIATEFMKNNYIFCIDELVLKDVGDALIFAKVYRQMLKKGAIFIATGNRTPQNLKPIGVGESAFKPDQKFIIKTIITKKLDSNCDFRSLENNFGFPYIKFYPNDIFFNKFKKIAQHIYTDDIISLQKEQTITVRSRKINIDFTYKEMMFSKVENLLSKNLGSEDFLEITKKFKYCFISNLAPFDSSGVASLQRFIIFMDYVYAQGGILILNLNHYIDPINICQTDILKFEFKRSYSRLLEMQKSEFPWQKYL